MRVKVAAKHAEAVGICSFELASVDGGPLPAFTAGSHVDVHVPGGPVRQYSLCNHPDERDRYVIAVLREAQSRGGSIGMHDGVPVGAELEVSEPRNLFPLHADRSPAILIAGGIGITPLLCMAESLSSREATFELHYCTRSLDRTAFAKRLAHAPFAKRVRLHHDDGPDEQRLDLDAVLGGAPNDAHLYICGPQGFIEAVRTAAWRHGWAQERVHVEFFTGASLNTTPDGAADALSDAPFELELARSHRVIAVPASQSALQALLDAGIDVPSSCEQGVCGTCLTKVLRGVPEHRDLFLTPAEQAANDQFLPCCSRSRSARLVVDL